MLQDELYFSIYDRYKSFLNLKYLYELKPEEERKPFYMDSRLCIMYMIDLPQLNLFRLLADSKFNEEEIEDILNEYEVRYVIHKFVRLIADKHGVQYTPLLIDWLCQGDIYSVKYDDISYYKNDGIIPERATLCEEIEELGLFIYVDQNYDIGADLARGTIYIQYSDGLWGFDYKC